MSHDTTPYPFKHLKDRLYSSELSVLTSCRSLLCLLSLLLRDVTPPTGFSVLFFHPRFLPYVLLFLALPSVYLLFPIFFLLCVNLWKKLLQFLLFLSVESSPLAIVALVCSDCPLWLLPPWHTNPPPFFLCCPKTPPTTLVIFCMAESSQMTFFVITFFFIFYIYFILFF